MDKVWEVFPSRLGEGNVSIIVRASHWEVNERGVLIFCDDAGSPCEALAEGEWGWVKEGEV